MPLFISNSLATMIAGVEPNYVNPPTRPPGTLICSIVFSIFVVTTLVLRIYTRVKITSTFGLDDGFAIIATCTAVSMYVIMAVGSEKYGWNRHIWDVPPSMYGPNRKLNLVYDILFSVSACLAKLSLLWFFRRLVGMAANVNSRRHYIALIIVSTIVSLCLVLFVVLSCVECRPLKAVWDIHPDYPYRCFNVEMFLLISSIINTATDVMCTLLPVSLVMGLRMRTRQKIAVASVFTLGLVANVASVLRIYYSVMQGKDATWGGYPALIAGAFEIGWGVVAVNAPILRPLVTHYKHYLSDGQSHGSRSTPFLFGTTLRGSMKPKSGKNDDSFFDRSEHHPLSVVRGESPKEAYNASGIEVTRTVELETFDWELGASCEQY